MARPNCWRSLTYSTVRRSCSCVTPSCSAASAGDGALLRPSRWRPLAARAVSRSATAFERQVGHGAGGAGLALGALHTGFASPPAPGAWPFGSAASSAWRAWPPRRHGAGPGPRSVQPSRCAPGAERGRAIAPALPATAPAAPGPDSASPNTCGHAAGANRASAATAGSSPTGGTSASARPCCSSTAISSVMPSPRPPCASGTRMAVQARGHALLPQRLHERRAQASCSRSCSSPQ